MNTELQKQKAGIKPVNIVIISIITFILLMLAIAGQFAYMVLKYDRIYKGVSFRSIDAGGLYDFELKSLLESRIKEKIQTSKIILDTGIIKEEFPLTAIDTDLDLDEAVENAFSVGRSGNFLRRLYDIFITARKGRGMEPPIVYNREKLEQIIDSLYDRIFVPVKEADLLFQDDRITIRSGNSGKSINKDKVLSEAENMIEEYKGGTINIPVIVTPPVRINREDLFSQINREPQDAQIKVENNNITVTPHLKGRKIDLFELSAVLNELEESEGMERVLPIQYMEPEITESIAHSIIFRDTLATFSSQFYTYDENNRNRAENIKIGISKINGLILGPGDVFSFNEVVGPRTADAGYKAAHIYEAGRVIDGVGGGICQVSSTLYNAVLFSDLQVIERRNHMFTVGYVPKGVDATVSYGEVDFKFKNSTRWPVKINAWVTDNNLLYFSLKGTNEIPGKTIEISPAVVKTENFKSVYIDAPGLPEGKTVIRQEGKPGFVVDTYKIVKQDGNIVNQIKLHTSVYKPLSQEILRGSGSTQANEPPGHIEDDIPHEIGVDDADNPPAEIEPESIEEKPDETAGDTQDEAAGKALDEETEEIPDETA